MLPKKYLQRIESFLSKTELEQTIKGYNEDRVCSFRVNTLKSTETEVESFLYSKNISFQKVSYIPLAYTIYREDEFALKGSPLFYEGKIYVQGLASQIPATLLEVETRDNKSSQKWWNSCEKWEPQWGVLESTTNEEAEFWTRSSHFGGLSVFDITAAPGSKTTQISALMKNTGKIIACEKHQIRHDKLVHNIKLQGATNIETHKMDALKLMSELEVGSFDAILLDAPCSAEGRFKMNDERTYGFWTLGNIRDKAILQKGLLEASIPLLKKGGTLVYSTCTLAPEENEGVVSDILAAHPELTLETIDSTNIPFARKGIKSFEGASYNSEIEKTIRILPSSMAEGFYVAKIRKT